MHRPIAPATTTSVPREEGNDAESESEPGVKFGWIALKVPFLDLELPLKLDCGIELRSQIELTAEFWVKGLGEWKLESLHECNLIVVASAPSEKPEILDAEHTALMERAWRFVLALVTVGARINNVPVTIKGSVIDSKEGVRMYSEGHAFMETEGCPYTIVNAVRIAEAEAVLRGINRLYGKVKEFRRLRKGFRSLMDGTEEGSCDDRVYFFARALEALHASKRTDGKATFVGKCQVFTGSRPEFKTLFEDLYDIRNNVVHVNGFEDLIKSGESGKQAEKRIVRQCVAAEILAKETYRRVLSDAVLLENFVDDAATRAWWATHPKFRPYIRPKTIRAKRSAEVEAWHDRL